GRMNQGHLDDAGLALPPAESTALASSYRLHAGQIGDAVAIARARRSLTECPVPDVADLRTAAGELAGRAVDGVARRVDVTHTWDDLVVEPDTRAQLAEMCERARHRDVVLRDWGLGRTGAAGTHALFSGPSGTGKTAAAQVIAGELGCQLRKVDLAAVVSKYIGETEKNLDAIFQAAADCDVVLLFDEADALFGKRSEVRDAHDRYANIEISYLLQRMEEHQGLTILTTNLRRNLDDAFLRRLAFDVRFPFPDEPARGRLWQQALGPAAPVAADVDVTALAAGYPLSGGQIRNVALAAAYLAASDGGAVRMRHLQLAVRREYQKLGKQIATDPADGP
ncbi:ATP-binding protein, partial [Cumulibacter manganitolerans]|uniref:ATP-binding protein n=1 Tax=Cumulibacter manganitolerans TaxID=1884992 RepID=UPI0018862587